MPSGGTRPGAGRKPKSEAFALPIRRAEKRIADRLPDLIDKLFELAEGVTIQEFDAKGEEKIYTRAPDRQACEYLLNRIMGRPIEKREVELAGRNGGPITIREIVVELPDEDTLED